MSFNPPWLDHWTQLFFAKLRRTLDEPKLHSLKAQLDDEIRLAAEALRECQKEVARLQHELTHTKASYENELAEERQQHTALRSQLDRAIISEKELQGELHEGSGEVNGALVPGLHACALVV